MEAFGRMHHEDSPDTEVLLQRASQGDRAAVDELLRRHRRRLRHMVAVRIDPRLKAHVDPSDVVQDTLLEAARKLPEFLQNRPLPYYPWLRQLAWQRLYDLYLRHIQTQARSVTREAQLEMELSDESLMHLAKHVVATGTTPSGGDAARRTATVRSPGPRPIERQRSRGPDPAPTSSNSTPRKSPRF